jgi:hypothetical protein
MDERSMPAPELDVEAWFNTPQPLRLADLRGRVVAIHAFQMLCPGCVAHGIPQAERLRNLFAPAGLVVIGLHAVFEHHAAMTPVALQAFLHEYRIGMPVAVDRAGGDDPVPRTMRAYGLRGTPSLLLIDRAGRLREHHFGRVDDLLLGAQVGALLHEDAVADGSGCADGRCAIS